MAEDSLKEKTAKGLIWGGLNNGIQLILNVGFGLILLRLLTPADYGKVGELVIFSSIAGALQEGGFISALNNRKNITQADYNSVFWFNVGVSVVLYTILFFCAPLIADFYHEADLLWLSRYVFLGFFFSSLNIVPRAYLFRELKTRETAMMSIFALLFSNLIGILLAYNGFAFWGIATQSLVFVACICWGSFHYSRWRPNLSFTLQPVREMFGFSSKLIVTSICNIVNANLFSVILGRYYGSVAAGNFSQANKWNYMGYNTISGMLSGIAQPVFAKVEENAERQQAVFRKLVRFTALLCFPALFGLSLIAREFTVIFMGKKWLDSAAILEIICIWGAFVPIISIFYNYIIARGRSKVYMWCTIALLVAQTIAIFAMRPWGMMNMFRIFVLVNVGWLFVWHYFVRQEMGLKLSAVAKDLAPYFLLSASLCLTARLLFTPLSSPLLAMVAKIVFVAVLYVGILWFARSVILREAVRYFVHKK